MSRTKRQVKRTQVLVSLLVAAIGAAVVLELVMAYAFNAFLQSAPVSVTANRH